MSWLLSLLGLVTRVWDFIHDQGQQQIGAQKQVIADDAKTIEIQQKELAAAHEHVDAVSSLQHHDF